jgi:hypothetical protein
MRQSGGFILQQASGRAARDPGNRTLRFGQSPQRIVLFGHHFDCDKTQPPSDDRPVQYLLLRLGRNSEVGRWSRYIAIANPWLRAPVRPAGRQLLTANEQQMQNCYGLTVTARMLRIVVEELRKGLRSVRPSSYALAMSSSVSSILAIATRNRRHLCSSRSNLLGRISPAS